MDLTKSLSEIQRCIVSLQTELDQLKLLDGNLAKTILLSRQEAADFMGVSLRQCDRCCRKYGIPKFNTVEGVKIRRTDLMIYMGLVREPIGEAMPSVKEPEETKRYSAFEKILERNKR